MTTFDQIVVKCPHCSTLMMDYELISYTTHGSSTYFSDGKNDEVPSMEDASGIGICVACKKPFWRSESKLPADQIDWKRMDNLPNVMDTLSLIMIFDEQGKERQIMFYKELLEQDFAKTEWQEFYLRKHLWWSINDIIRHLGGWTQARSLRELKAILSHRRTCKKLFRKYDGLLVQNLDRMIFLYIISADVDLLYLANMYREKGKFQKAMEILSKEGVQKGKTYSQLQRKISRKNHFVFKLS